MNFIQLSPCQKRTCIHANPTEWSSVLEANVNEIRVILECAAILNIPNQASRVYKRGSRFVAIGERGNKESVSGLDLKWW